MEIVSLIKQQEAADATSAPAASLKILYSLRDQTPSDVYRASI